MAILLDIFQGVDADDDWSDWSGAFVSHLNTNARSTFCYSRTSVWTTCATSTMWLYIFEMAFTRASPYSSLSRSLPFHQTASGNNRQKNIIMNRYLPFFHRKRYRKKNLTPTKIVRVSAESYVQTMEDALNRNLVVNVNLDASIVTHTHTRTSDNSR